MLFITEKIEIAYIIQTKQIVNDGTSIHPYIYKYILRIMLKNSNIIWTAFCVEIIK